LQQVSGESFGRVSRVSRNVFVCLLLHLAVEEAFMSTTLLMLCTHDLS